MIRLKKVTQENFWECIELSVSKEQYEYVTSNAISIAQSKVQPECKPMCIYDDELLLGFLMYCIDSDDDEYWIYRLMIDEKYQSKGYGEKSLQELIDSIKKDKKRNKIYLGVHIDSVKAVNLYKKFNFEFNGQIFGSEHIMVLKY